MHELFGACWAQSELKTTLKTLEKESRVGVELNHAN